MSKMSWMRPKSSNEWAIMGKWKGKRQPETSLKTTIIRQKSKPPFVAALLRPLTLASRTVGLLGSGPRVASQPLAQVPFWCWDQRSVDKSRSRRRSGSLRPLFPHCPLRGPRPARSSRLSTFSSSSSSLLSTFKQVIVGFKAP